VREVFDKCLKNISSHMKLEDDYCAYLFNSGVKDFERGAKLDFEDVDGHHRINLGGTRLNIPERGI
jgi:hypothetical protein